FEEEAASVRDARRTPIRFRGYSVSHRGGHPHVRIEHGEYKRLKAYFLDLATHRSAERLAGEKARPPFQPHAAVRRQQLPLAPRPAGRRGAARAVTRGRGGGGSERVRAAASRLKRRGCRPFEPVAPGRE